MESDSAGVVGDVCRGPVGRLGPRFLCSARRDFLQAANVRVVHATRRGVGYPRIAARRDVYKATNIHVVAATRRGHSGVQQRNRVEFVGRVLDGAAHSQNRLFGAVLFGCWLRFRHDTRIAKPLWDAQ